MGICSSALASCTPGSRSTTGGKIQISEAARGDVEKPYLIGKILDEPNLKEFTFAELKIAARKFRPNTLVGEGSFGQVYKGWVDEKTLAPSKSDSGLAVAIKKLKPGSVLGFKEWQTEVNILGRCAHPNLIRLLGFCCEDKNLLLVYEFMPEGSLDNHLFKGNHSTEPLSWGKRLKIAIGAARGLVFLHTLEKQVIHRNLKPSNILLDGEYNAKLSGFGLARLGPEGEESHVSTRVMGTYGYAAPEYIATGHLTVKCDVYGFGIVLLELMTGSKTIDIKRHTEKRNLVEWAKRILREKNKKVKNLMDARIEGQYSLEAAVKAGNLTLKCLETDPKIRPSMQEVLEVLERIEELS